MMANRDLPGRHVRDHHGHEERRDLAGAALVVAGDLSLGGANAAHARAHVDAQALGVDGALGIESRGLHGLVGGDEGKLDVAVVVERVGLAEGLDWVKALDLCRHGHAESGGVEGRDGVDAARASDKCLPALLGRVPNGGDGPHACYDYPAIHLSPFRACGPAAAQGAMRSRQMPTCTARRQCE